MSNRHVALVLFGVLAIAACGAEPASPPHREPAPATATAETTAETTTTTPSPPPAAPPPVTMTTPRTPSTTPPPVSSFAVTALSRGKGVPPEARAAYRQVVELAEDDQRRGLKVTVDTTRIGIEGETRACITYEDPQAGARAYERARDLVKNVDLVTLTTGPCAESQPAKEEEP